MSYCATYVGGPKCGGFDLIMNLDEPVARVDVQARDGSFYRYELDEEVECKVNGTLFKAFRFICRGISNDDLIDV